MARQGPAGLGAARQGAGQGVARLGQARQGKAWNMEQNENYLTGET
jgi:hypothetical protein